MAGFTYRGQISGAQDPILENLVIANSETVTVGDAVKMSTGYVAVCDAGDMIYGIVVGIVDNNGIDLSNPHADFDGTWTDSANTYVAADDNSTDKKVKAVVCPDPFALWYNDADGDLAVADLKMHFNLIDEDQIDASTNVANYGEMQLWKWDPDEDSDASKGLFRISSWQGYAYEPETS